MTWLADKLRYRIQIRKPVQTPNDAGGFDRLYETLLTIWAGFKPTKFGSSFSQAMYAQGQQIRQNITHEFLVRRSSVQNLGKAFGDGFGSGFNSIADLIPLKSDLFIFLQKGSTVKGRSFKIHRVQDNDEKREFIKLFCEEIEEQGTGFPE